MTQSRKSLAQSVRNQAAQVAADRPHPRHVNNKEEYEYRDVSKKGTPPTYIANYTKGLPHDTETGLVLNPVDYKLFVQGIQSGDPVDFKNTPLGPGKPPLVPDTPSRELIDSTVRDRRDAWQSNIAKSVVPKDAIPCKDGDEECEEDTGARVRASESAGAGNVFDLEGPDAQAVTMPPAPRFDGDELVAEMAEVYSMALLRDRPFSQFPLPEGSRRPPRLCKVFTETDKEPVPKDGRNAGGDFGAAVRRLRDLPWFKKDSEVAERDPTALARRRILRRDGKNAFRGVTPGEEVGPYLSQFLILGNRSLEGSNPKPARVPTDGFIQYGAMGIEQRVRVATENRDYMTTWNQYVDVQNGADLRGRETYEDDGRLHRFIATPRDLATYVHYDALYEAYLNACIFLLASGAPFDRGIPFLEGDTFDKQQGFAHFGGPHILTLVTEAATRALKAVRYQKFNLHRRLRPEALAARLDRWKNAKELQKGPLAPLEELTEKIEGAKWNGRTLLQEIEEHNRKNNEEHWDDEPDHGDPSYLLPMAFPEGSPMHPAYGAGHATVAAACVTILKAYFDHGWTPPEFMAKAKDIEKEAGCSGDEKVFKPGTAAEQLFPIAYEPTASGASLRMICLDKPLTVEGELNKLAANISIGRNWAGVHYYTDYIESFRMGEQIAIGLLEEQKLTYPENFTMTVPLFDGGSVRI